LKVRIESFKRVRRANAEKGFFSSSKKTAWASGCQGPEDRRGVLPFLRFNPSRKIEIHGKWRGVHPLSKENGPREATRFD
jgi:hypothetical protein